MSGRSRSAQFLLGNTGYPVRGYEPFMGTGANLRGFYGQMPVSRTKSRTEVVGGGAVTTFGASAVLTTAHPDRSTWTGLQVTAGSASGGAIALTPVNFLTGITVTFTILVDVDISGSDAFGHLISQPNAAGTWTTPFSRLGFYRQNLTTDMTLAWGDAANRFTISSSIPGMWATGRNLFAVMRDGTSTLFMRNSTAFGTPTIVSGGAVAPLPSTQPITLLNRSSTAPGEATRGTLHRLTILNQALSQTAISNIWLSLMSGVHG